ncbi:MAG: hypothetical protein R3E08_00955 [Thiotrichaceae bacterium]
MAKIGTAGWVGLQCNQLRGVNGALVGCGWKCGKASGSDLSDRYLPSSCKDLLTL